MRPRSWWIVAAIALSANYPLMRACSPEPSWITIPYTFFKEQVAAGNVESVSSRGDAIRGIFKAEVTYPTKALQAPEASKTRAPAWLQSAALEPRTSNPFGTQRPAFADPGFESLLEDKGVVIEARDERRLPSLTLPGPMPRGSDVSASGRP